MFGIIFHNNTQRGIIIALLKEREIFPKSGAYDSENFANPLFNTILLGLLYSIFESWYLNTTFAPKGGPLLFFVAAICYISWYFFGL